jgi:D-alanyl-D-alanine dipeptidase
MNAALGALALCMAVAPTSPVRLVDASQAVPGAVLDIRYATTHNFLHKAVYSAARCLLDPAVAASLARVEGRLEAEGFRLKLWDCYRPFSVQKEMWKLVPVRGLVADPSRGGSRHNRGSAVDASLVALDGTDIEMPTDHDDFTAAGRRDAPCRSARACQHRAVLRAAMEAEGFTTIRTEWWHFEGTPSASSGPLDEPL